MPPPRLSLFCADPPRTGSLQAGLFDVDDAEKLVEYMLNSYFRHYKLYRYIFTRRLQVTLVQTLPHGVETPPPPKPPAEALPSQDQAMSFFE